MLTQIENLSTLTNLDTLDLCMNKITSLKGIENLKELTELWINNNEIEDFNELDLLKNNPNL